MPTTTTNRACPLCRCTNAEALPRYARGHLVRCTSCALIFAGRPPSHAELVENYSRYPRTHEISPLTLERYREILRDLKRKAPGSALLDVGAGVGHFVEQAAALGWNASGLEFDSAAVASAAARGVRLDLGELGKDPYRDEQFDVVALIEVIEHLLDPAPSLERIHRILKPGGLVYLTTPNFGSLTRRVVGSSWRAIEYPEHLNYFDVSSMRKMLEPGFDLLRVETTGITPGDIKAHIKRGFRDGERPSNANALEAESQELRGRIEGNPALSAAKFWINKVLSACGVGDTLKITARKRSDS